MAEKRRRQAASQVREQRVLQALAANPSLSLDALGEQLGVSRNTAAAIVARLVARGALSERGYYSPDRAHPPQITGIVLVKSPTDAANIPRLEAHLNSFSRIGHWKFIADSEYDYVFFLHVDNTSPLLGDFYAAIRELGGTRSDTHFLIDPH